MMNTIELFSGTGSFSKVATELGHLTFQTDFALIDHQDLVKDVRDIDVENDIPFDEVDMLWASPPCEGFSVACIGRNWNHDHTPKTDSARLGMELVQHTLRLIEELEPKWWFIENPRGKLRKLPFMQDFIRHTVTYCQYGDNRMKPTDIWTNAPWWTPRPMCKNGMPCHVAAPRGSQTGTQGLQNYKEKSRIPAELFKEIFEQHKKYEQKRSRHDDTDQ